MAEPEIRIYRINRHPTDDDLANYCTHSCNPDYVKDIVFRFQMSSVYPQSYLVKLDQQRSSALVTINGVRVHIILCSSKTNPHYSLYTYPDKEENIKWYEKIFMFLVDLSDAKQKGLTEEEICKKLLHSSK